MKRFTTATAVFGVSILAVWAISVAYTASQPRASDENASAKAQPVPNEVKEAINPGSESVIPATP